MFGNSWKFATSFKNTRLQWIKIYGAGPPYVSKPTSRENIFRPIFWQYQDNKHPYQSAIYTGVPKKGNNRFKQSKVESKSGQSMTD